MNKLKKITAPQVIEAFEKNNVELTCPICGNNKQSKLNSCWHNHFNISDAITELHAFNDNNISDVYFVSSELSMPTVSILCTKCGYIMSFSLYYIYSELWETLMEKQNANY
jgi:RNase P subunit RPR2